MKKVMTAVVVLALALPVLALASPYTTSFKDGKYDGVISSVVPEQNGMKAKAEVKHEGDNAVFTVTYTDGSKEVWKLSDTKLEQQEFTKEGKADKAYSATAAKTPTGTEQSFNINCKDKAKNDCDAGVDSRFYWTLKSTPEAIVYSYYGVPKAQKGDPNAKVEKRGEFTFKAAK